MPSTGNTSQRGYGWRHRQRVQQLHHAHIDGTPCRRCGEPMYRTQPLDGGHAPGTDPTVDLPDALEHAWCNRRAGQATATHNRTNTQRFRQSRGWLE